MKCGGNRAGGMGMGQVGIGQRAGEWNGVGGDRWNRAGEGRWEWDICGMGQVEASCISLVSLSRLCPVNEEL